VLRRTAWMASSTTRARRWRALPQGFAKASRLAIESRWSADSSHRSSTVVCQCRRWENGRRALSRRAAAGFDLHPTFTRSAAPRNCLKLRARTSLLPHLQALAVAGAASLPRSAGDPLPSSRAPSGPPQRSRCAARAEGNIRSSIFRDCFSHEGRRASMQRHVNSRAALRMQRRAGDTADCARALDPAPMTAICRD